MLNFDNRLGMAKYKLGMLLSPLEFAQGILLRRLNDMLDFVSAVFPIWDLS
jgi:hypothetical protein